MRLAAVDDATAQRLVVVTAADGSRREIQCSGSNQIFYPIVWTPDGKSVIVGVLPMDETMPATSFLRIDIATGAAKKLPLDLGGRVLSFALHPDGNRIAFSANAQNAGQTGA